VKEATLPVASPAPSESSGILTARSVVARAQRREDRGVFATL
jgi:hypothetical protein